MNFGNRKVIQAWRRLLSGDPGKIAKSWKFGVPMLMALTALGPTFPGGAACAAEPGADASGDTHLDAPSDPPTSSTEAANAANADLLLFWEQKELYVETATRTVKPISQVAENMEVVTAKDIQDMNAHTVNEVLNRVPGLFVSFGINGIDSSAQFYIQGSSPRHVTVLVDGIFWNFLLDGHAETFGIPVGIIDRIEIIKGPASSVWGSGLGGVINIITKAPGDTTIPKGMITASLGQADSRDVNGQLFGKAGMVRYFLHAGHLASNGLVDSKNSENDSYFGKVSLSPNNKLDVTMSAGYSGPDLSEGISRGGLVDYTGGIENNFFHALGSIEYRFSPDWNLKGEISNFRNRTAPLERAISSATIGPFTINPGDVVRRNVAKEDTTSGNLRLTYSTENNTAVVGGETSHGSLDFSLSYPWRNVNAHVNPDVDKWAVFGNDTLTLGSFAITPGIRLDHNNISGSFVSPSLGATYQFSEKALARASVARGFTYPPFLYTSGGGVLSVPNPGAQAESGWSYQVGFESVLGNYVNTKLTLFRHDIKNGLSDATNDNGQFYNIGKIHRQGYEISAETAPWYNVSLKLANSYAHIDPDVPLRSSDIYSYQVGIKYDDRKYWQAQLFGNYVWWDDLPGATSPGAKFDNFVWDANVNRKFVIDEQTSFEAFFTMHNIFGANYYTSPTQPNPGMWFEAGLKFRF